MDVIKFKRLCVRVLIDGTPRTGKTTVADILKSDADFDLNHLQFLFALLAIILLMLVILCAFDICIIYPGFVSREYQVQLHVQLPMHRNVMSTANSVSQITRQDVFRCTILLVDFFLPTIPLDVLPEVDLMCEGRVDEIGVMCLHIRVNVPV